MPASTACARPSQPVASATSTCFFASNGRAIEVPSRYLSSYTQPARTIFHTYSLTNSSFMSATCTSLAPVFSALASRPLSSSPPCPMSPQTATTSQP